MTLEVQQELDIVEAKKRRKAIISSATVPLKMSTHFHTLQEPDGVAPAKVSSLARILILEEINDSSNLCKILRCGEAFGIKESASNTKGLVEGG